MLNKKNAVVVSFTLLLGVIAVNMVASPLKTYTNLNAQDNDYVLTLNATTNTASSLISTGKVTTTSQNKVNYEYNSLTSVDGYWGKLEENGYFVNTNEIKGITGLICEFEGSLNIDLKYAGMDNYVRFALPLTSGEYFNFGIETPDYIRFNTETGALISSISYRYSCVNTLPEAYKDQYVVSGDSTDSVGGLKMEIDTTNKDTSYVRYLKDVEVTYGQTYKIANNDFSTVASKDSYRLDNAAILAGQYTVNEEGVINFTYNGTYTFEYCVPTPTKSYDRSWVGLKDLPKVLYSENHLGLYGVDNKVEYLFDNNEQTYFLENGVAEPGSYIIIDLEEVTHVSYLEIIYSYSHALAAHYPHISYSTTGIDAEDFTLAKFIAGDLKVNGIVSSGFDARFIKLSNENPQAIAWWVSIAEIYINNSNYNDPRVELQGFINQNGNDGIYQGTTKAMFDGNKESYVWFNEFPQAGAYILIDYGRIIEDVNYINVFFKNMYEDSPAFFPVLQYSDGISGFKTLTETNNVNNLVLSLDETIDIRYLKLTHFTAGVYDKWVSIGEVILDTVPVVNTEDFLVGGFYQGSAKDMFDGDFETFAWFNNYPLNGGYILVDYLNTQIDVSTIYINFYNGFNDPFCYLPVISYSLDGIEYTDITTTNENNLFLYYFETPISFRYLKIANTYDETRAEDYHYGAWIGISEIQLNRPIPVSLSRTNMSETIYQGTLFDIFDGYAHTFAWFASAMSDNSYIEIEYSHLVITNRLRILFKDGNNSACYATQIQVRSSEDEEWQVLVSGNNSNEVIIEQSLSFKYLRLSSPGGNGGLWLSIASIDF